MIARSIRSVSILTLTAVCLWLAPSTASAAFVLTISPAGQQTSTVAGVTTENFNSLSTGLFTSLSTAVGNFTAPSPGTAIVAADQYGGAGNVGNYFAVGNQSTPNLTSTLTLTAPNTPASYFGLWLSAIDDGNRMEFYSGATLVDSYDFNGLAASLPAAYVGVNGNTIDKAAYLNFTGTSGTTITSIKFFSRSGSGFEADNFSVLRGPANPVPEPTTMTLGLLGTLMLGGIARFRHKAVVA